VKVRILHVWEQRRAEAKDRTAEQEKRVKVIQQKLDRLDEAFLFAQSIDATSYERQRDRLREELTLAQIDHHAEAVDELDVQGILAFAERVLPRASDLWVQAPLDYKQRLQQLFFPEGIAYDGNRFNRTAVTAPLFNYLAPSESADERVVSRRRNRTGLPSGRFLNVRTLPEQPPLRPAIAPGGGRSWWAHLEFTRINIELTIRKNQVEELMNVKGIGEKSSLRLKPHVSVAADKAAQGEKQ
jgi:hypothetical protein